jgi:hypothetical protein
VAAFDEEGAVLFTASTEALCTSLPAGVSLGAGRHIAWTVVALRAGRREQSLELSFSTPDAADLQLARAAIAAAQADASGAGRHLAALGLAQMGLAQRAQALWPDKAGESGEALAPQESVPAWRRLW